MALGQARPDQPLVTIVITSYNYGKYVADAISSALSQTYRNIEVLVCDNASTDNSLEVIRSFSDERLRVIARTENVGIQRNHNDAILEARGDYVVFLSADDMLLPTLVEDVLDYRRLHPDIDIVYASVCIVNKDLTVAEYFDHQQFDAADSYTGRNEFANLLSAIAACISRRCFFRGRSSPSLVCSMNRLPLFSITNTISEWHRPGRDSVSSRSRKR